MWEAVERTPDVFDDAYLVKVTELINKMGEKGLYTMVDAHQDVFARTICGEGVPAFYATDKQLNHSCRGIIPGVLARLGICTPMKDYGYRKDENGWPVIEDCQTNPFAVYYTSPESESAFNRLYQNVDGLRDKFLAYWDKVASVF